MARETLYSTQDENEVDGYFYALGNTLSDDVDDETREKLVADGRFSTVDPHATPNTDCSCGDTAAHS